jgi:hypothetical protein
LSAVANSVVGMEADKNPDYLRQLADYVCYFRDAFESLMDCTHPPGKAQPAA